MIELFALSGLSIVLFASTNIDDIFVLLSFFADRRFRSGSIAIGQFLGISSLVIVSVIASLVSLLLAPAYVGLLGLLPVLIGVKKLLDLRSDHAEETQAHEARGDALGQVASVAAVTTANGGDNIGVYTPVFATQTAAQIVVVLVVFATMTALWLVLAHWLVSHRTIGAPIRRYGRSAAPFVLIALGVLILYEAGSFALLR